MKLFAEKIEAAKSPFLAGLANKNTRAAAENQLLEPLGLTLRAYQEKDAVNRVDHLYHLDAKLDARVRDRFRSKKDLRHALLALRDQEQSRARVQQG